MRTVDELRPVTAGRLLELWRKCREELEDPLERTVFCNARILAESCFCQGERVYQNECEVLADLTGQQIAALLREVAENGETTATSETINPAFEQGRFDTLRRG